MSEQLGSLQIIEKASSKYKKTDIEMSAAPAPAPALANKNIQAVISKSMGPDPVWFDRDQTKFEDWWREIQLYLKSNKVIETNDRITVILACLRGGVVGIYAQKKA